MIGESGIQSRERAGLLSVNFADEVRLGGEETETETERQRR